MPVKQPKIALIIPTLNAEKDHWAQILRAIKQQSLQPDYKLILDSSSLDNTIAIAEKFNFDIHPVTLGSFDHAGTRKWGLNLVKNKADIVIFMTQDALLNNINSFKNLIDSFKDDLVAVAYGRQLPKKNALPIEKFGRIQNYPKKSEVRSFDDRKKLGMKAAFCSDAFAAYRIESINKYDAFPYKSIVGEDTTTVANMLMNGYNVYYNAEATIEHSHDYTITQEFQRYFDTGVFHDEFPILLRTFGTAEKTGANYVKEELIYLTKNNPSYIPISILRTISKYIGYKLGRNHKHLSTKIKKMCAMHKYYFS